MSYVVGGVQDAQFKFVRSMAAYSIICYILKVKDRHDGNILLQRDGSVVHIDWSDIFSLESLDEY